MTGNAPHSELVRLSPIGATNLEDTLPGSTKRLTSRTTWLVAVFACLTALVVKISQQWLISVDAIKVASELSSTFDWAAIALCICVLALVAVQSMSNDVPSNEPEVETSISITTTPDIPNLSLPAPDDSRLRLAQSISHELRTPLNAVIGFTDLMNHELHGNLGHPKYNEYCAHISASSQSLLRTVDDILALNTAAATDLTNRVPLPIARALRKAWEENSIEGWPAIRGTRLEISGDTEPTVIADPEILSHALKNVVDTLSRHSAENTTVSAVIRNEDGKTRLYCTTQLDETQLVETAPLIQTGTIRNANERASRDTLAEIAATALVHQMDGELVIRRPAGTLSLEVICDLPAPRNENTPNVSSAIAVA